MNHTFVPRVTNATFIAMAGAEGSIHILVDGENFLARAAPLSAKLGEQVLHRVVPRADGRGFIGVLERAPTDGDRLFVGYADSELAPTDVVYRSGGDASPPPRVA